MKTSEKRVYLSQIQINMAINAFEEVSRLMHIGEIPKNDELKKEIDRSWKILSKAQHNQIYKNQG